MATTYGNISAVTSGLTLCVDAANLKSYPTTGTTWTDISRRSSNGTLTNFGGSFWDSNNGGSILFDGIDSYIDFSDVPFRITNYSFTLECVFYFTGGTYTNMSIIGKRNPNVPYNAYALGINNGDPYGGGTGKVLVVFLRDDNNPNSALYDRVLTYTLPSEGIYHAVITNNQSQAQLWVNGVVRSTSTTSLFSGNFNMTGYNFRIGNYYAGVYWNEKIYLARFYNRTLSNSEILQNYNATKWRFQ